MKSTCLRKRLKDGGILLGLLNCYPSAAIIETVGDMWDFVWIDGQHGQFSYDSALNAVRVVDLVGAYSVLRVPGKEYGVIGPFADMAPSALMIPMVDNAEQAKAVVDAVRFPPLGNRSYGGRRPIDLFNREYYQNHEPLIIAQIETPEALENADQIAATEGIDALFFGADDLKIRIGLPIDAPVLENERLTSALVHVAQVAKAAGKSAGCVAPGKGLFRRSVELGYKLLMGGSDKAFILDASRESVKSLRNVLDEIA